MSSHDIDSTTRRSGSAASGPRRITRRAVLSGAGGALLAGAGLTACGVDARRTEEEQTGGAVELTILIGLGADLGVMPREFKAEWEDSHPHVRLKLHEASVSVEYSKMVAHRESNPEDPLFNIVMMTGLQAEQGVLDNMWAPLEIDSMSSADGLRPEFTRDDDYGVPISVEQFGLTVNSEFLRPPDSWNALWDESNRDRVTYFGFPWYALTMAASLNGGSSNDLEPGWELFAEHAENIRVLVTSNPQFLDVMSNGTAPLSAFLAGTSQAWIDGGEPMTFVVPDEGGLALPISLHAVAGQSDAQLEACREIIDAMASPRWNRRWAETSRTIPARTDVSIPAAMANLAPFRQSVIENLGHADYQYLAQNMAELSQRWESDIVPRI